MCARFTVLSDTPIAAAIAGCAIPLSRNNTIWMHWRCAAGMFHRSAVLSRRTSALLHLTICFPESDGAANHTSGNKNNQQFPLLTSKSSIQAVMEMVLDTCYHRTYAGMKAGCVPRFKDCGHTRDPRAVQATKTPYVLATSSQV